MLPHRATTRCCVTLTTTRLADSLRVEVHDTAGSLGQAAADDAAGVLREAVARRGVAYAMFATGNSQLEMIERLTSDGAGVPWHAVVAFHMDEYVGVGPDHPAGFARWIRERIAGPAHPRAVHYLDGLADPVEECARYAALLDAHPLDLCCLGIGENGHLAFNDPPVADFEDPLSVKVVELDPECRAQQVGEGHFASVADVPPRAMTVTVPALLRPARLVVTVPDARKADAVGRALGGPIETACPASILRTVPQAVLYLDQDSAARIP